MATVILFALGAIVGSFLNVVALRYNSGLSLGGRSSCGHCGHKLSWFELVPILSYLALAGRCRSCRVKISRQYPLVELWTALLFVTLPPLFLPAFCAYVVITVYDARHKIIPDGLVYASVALALPAALAAGDRGLLDWLAGPALFSFFALFWLFSKGRAMGFGDAKLAFSMGLLLGAAEGFSAAVSAFWFGAAWGIMLLLIRGRNTKMKSEARISMKSELPFAPFLVFGSWAAAALNLDLFHVSTILALFS